MNDKKKTDSIQLNGINDKKDTNKDIESTEKELNNKYPCSIPFIIGNEFCERFCFYGMKAILTLYFINVLNYDDKKATEAFHLFVVFAYFTPLLGAFIADSYLGKYLTILYLSIVYVAGNILISYASYLQNEVLTITGLGLIALGTGGIKPCVSAFGGDQFKENQTHLLDKFFSLFYLSINLGSLVSMFVTPIFKNDISCFGQNSCYPLAFGVPALLMIIALLLFLIGTPFYVRLPASKGNIVADFLSCIIYSLYKKISNLFKQVDKPDHFLDYALSKYPSNLVQDSKAVLSVFLLYVPLPVFWALFDQQGSKWVLQAEHTDGEVNFFGWHYTIRPDQFQVFNPLFIVLLVPIFDYAVYPVLKKMTLFTKPLQKMGVGGLLAAVSFLCAGLLQLHIQSSKISPPPAGQTNFNLILLSSKQIESVNLIGKIETQTRKNELENRFIDFGSINLDDYTLSIQFPNQQNFTSKLELKDQTSFTAIISEKNNVLRLDIDETPIKPIYNQTQLKIYLNQDKYSSKYRMLYIKNEKINLQQSFALPTNGDIFISQLIQLAENSDGYEIYLDDKKINYKFNGKSAKSYKLIILIEENGEVVTSSKESKKNIEYEWLNFKQVSILWQLLQYFVITSSEIMFSITGLSFSYSEAPTSMKSVVSAVWLLVVALGNFVVVIITSFLNFESQSTEFFFYGLLMALNMLVFIVLAYFYKPRNHQKEIEERDLNC